MTSWSRWGARARTCPSACHVRSLHDTLRVRFGRTSRGVSADRRSTGAVALGAVALTSVEIPYSIACALPSLTVIDITNDVAHELARNGHHDGIAYVSPTDETGIVRVNEREGGFFEELEDLLAGLVPHEVEDRARLWQVLAR